LVAKYLAKEQALQSRDELSAALEPRYPDRSNTADELKPFPAAQRMAAVIAALLVPGAGHLILGRVGRAALFFVTIAGAFMLGLSLYGRLFWPMAVDPQTGVTGFDFISALWFFSQIGSGLCYAVAYALGFGTDPNPAAATFEYGNTLTFLAGLLNYLVVYDAYDIAAGRKR
jgi:hypothetical protein